LTEGIAVGFVAWLIGLPLGYFISSGIFSALDVPEQYDLGFPIEAVVVGLFGMLIITAVASFWPSLVAARKTVSDILRYQ
jgi:ABC-type antimicrobial peptide transport system permease subunit